jgi:hypothetical protein
LSVSTLIVSSIAKSPFYSSPGLKGQAWSQSGSLSKNWTAISVNNTSGVYFAVATGDYIYYTTNGGATWTQQGTVQNWSAITIDTYNPSSAIACVAGGGIYYTSNSGTTWTLSASAPTANWSGACGTTTPSFNACVNGGGIYYSSDGGVTWTLSSVAPTKNWTSICGGLYNCYAICSGSTTPLFYGANNGWANTSAAIPSGNWNSVTNHIVNYNSPINGDVLIVGRSDGFNYLFNRYTNSVTVLPVKGYVGSTWSGSIFYAALPLSPIQVSYDYGATWLVSSSPSLNWSCISPFVSPTVYATNSVPSTTAVNPCLVGVTAGYIYGDVPDSANTTGDLNVHNTTIRSDTGTVNIQANTFAINSTGTSQIRSPNVLVYGTVYFSPDFANYIVLPRSMYRYAPATGNTVPQPFIQNGTAAAGSTSPFTVTLPYAYSNTGYTIQLTNNSSSPSTIFSATALTSSTFSIAWTSGSGSQSVFWTTFG